ncbi:hypothetical protein GCM10009559_42000 [Pseudonocardia zijingensis]|uniref:Uncharacterized protein n=1 Tax=Pseudonocardia zijingensis TaxID=153376 RepID=A0ABN1QLQ7_9PSEU
MPALQHLEVLADGHRGDAEAAHEVGHADPAVDVEQAQHLLLPLVLRDARHARTVRSTAVTVNEQFGNR